MAHLISSTFWTVKIIGPENSSLTEVKDFSRLYNRKAHVHHYTEYMEKVEFDEAFETVNTLMKDYISLDMLQLCIANRGMWDVSFAHVAFFLRAGGTTEAWNASFLP